MDAKLTLHMAEYFLKNVFPSKRVMAISMGISYRALLRLYSGKCSEKDVKSIMIGIAQYCLQERIAPQELFCGFCTI